MIKLTNVIAGNYFLAGLYYGDIKKNAKILLIIHDKDLMKQVILQLPDYLSC
jgi:hypothetical protein